jgi:hypothetical protein
MRRDLLALIGQNRVNRRDAKALRGDEKSISQDSEGNSIFDEVTETTRQRQNPFRALRLRASAVRFFCHIKVSLAQSEAAG